jgi:hypothetical protein
VPPKRVWQRCPNCDFRADVSVQVAGALVRCGHCGVRFEVKRASGPDLPARPSDETAPVPACAAGPGGAPRDVADDRLRWEELAAVGNPNAVSRAPEPGAAPAPKPMPHLDGFALHEQLGQGGMGEVYRATRLVDARPVAVKVLSATLAVVPD